MFNWINVYYADRRSINTPPFHYGLLVCQTDDGEVGDDIMNSTIGFE